MSLSSCWRGSPFLLRAGGAHPIYWQRGWSRLIAGAVCFSCGRRVGHTPMYWKRGWACIIAGAVCLSCDGRVRHTPNVLEPRVGLSSCWRRLLLLCCFLLSFTSFFRNQKQEPGSWLAAAWELDRFEWITIDFNRFGWIYMAFYGFGFFLWIWMDFDVLG